jgi:hypothetical protein
MLGTEDINFENIDYSGAQEALSDCTFTGGTLGFQQFGIAQFDFALGPKDGKFHFKRTGPYRKIISSAEKTPVLLYDTGERRAWLVPASSVMLHIAQHRHWLEPFTVDDEPVRFHTGQSARETLLKSALVQLSDEEQYNFRDMITNIWSLFEYLIDQKVAQDRKPGKKIHAALQEILFGFEYKAVVEERSPFRQKKCTLARSNGGWLPLIQDIDALVLFANGFEDLIRPQGTNEGLCHRWRTVPKQKDYLATTVETLIDLYDVSGCRLSREYLTSTQLCWHRGKSLLFEPCAHQRKFRCSCSRLQQIIPKASLGTPIPPGELRHGGGVIFGASGNPLDNISWAKESKQPSFYRQPNVTISSLAMQDSDESASYSESGKSSLGSDTSGVSAASSMTSYSSQDVDGIFSLKDNGDKSQGC